MKTDGKRQPGWCDYAVRFEDLMQEDERMEMFVVPVFIFEMVKDRETREPNGL